MKTIAKSETAKRKVDISKLSVDELMALDEKVYLASLSPKMRRLYLLGKPLRGKLTKAIAEGTVNPGHRKTGPAVVRISKPIDQALSRAAKDFGITRASIIRQALLEYLEGMADSKTLAEARKKGGKMVPFSDLRKELGL